MDATINRRRKRNPILTPTTPATDATSVNQPLTADQLKTKDPINNLEFLLYGLAEAFVFTKALKAIGLDTDDIKEPIRQAIANPLAEGIQHITGEIKKMGINPSLVATGLLVGYGLYKAKQDQLAKEAATKPPVAPEYEPMNQAGDWNTSAYRPGVTKNQGWQ